MGLRPMGYADSFAIGLRPMGFADSFALGLRPMWKRKTVTLPRPGLEVGGSPAWDNTSTKS